MRKITKKHSRRSKIWFVVLLLLAVSVTYGLTAIINEPTPAHVRISFTRFKTSSVPTPKNTSAASPTTVTKPQPLAAAPTPQPTTACSSNKLNQLVVVSISSRHLWGCEAGTVVYDSPVITGMENIAADLTPTGTYHIYSKQTNLYLKGSDSTGSWNDYVYYWMPFLNNQYGTYGFHDATWRSNDAFGNVDPYSSNASHGCVELPISTAKWLYTWSQVGTTLTIVS